MLHKRRIVEQIRLAYSAQLQQSRADMKLSKERKKLYKRIEAKIGNTPLVELTNIGKIPNNCRIFAKEEYRNPTGSHYDRQTVALLKAKEQQLPLTPDTDKALLETTTGSSGASFAWMCNVLGFKATIFIPEDMPSARIQQIKSYGAIVKTSPKGTYIQGLIRAAKKYQVKHRDKVEFINHSEDTEFAPKAMDALAEEIVDDFVRLDFEPPEYAVLALGNGISANGIGRTLGKHGTTIYGMEPYESPTVFEKRHKATSKTFKDKFPKKTGGNYSSHKIIGTGPGEIKHNFENIAQANLFLEDIIHVKTEHALEMRNTLMFKELALVGNSSAAVVCAALKLAEKVPARSKIVVIFYDAAWRYLDI